MSSKTYNRRGFIKALGILGLGAAVAPVPAMAAVRMADVKRLGDKRFKVSETRFLMGTYVAMTALHESKHAAEQAVGRAFDEIERLCAIFDRHQGNTPVAELNRTGRLTDVAPELHAVMEQARQLTALSGGAFDPTVLPLVELLKRSANPQGRIDIADNELAESLELVDSTAVHLSEREIRFDKQGMGVTFDGIGKGYIVDRASDMLAANGVANHLVNAGGDIRARGERAPGHPWMVAIEDPARKGRYPAVIKLKDAAVATSGGYEVFYDARQAHHHVVDPKTAHCPTQSISVSVTAHTVMEADALATAAFVMAPKAGAAMIDEMPGRECLIVGSSGATVVSRHWNNSVKA